MCSCNRDVCATYLQATLKRIGDVMGGLDDCPLDPQGSWWRGNVPCRRHPHRPRIGRSYTSEARWLAFKGRDENLHSEDSHQAFVENRTIACLCLICSASMASLNARFNTQSPLSFLVSAMNRSSEAKNRRNIKLVQANLASPLNK